MTRSRNRALSSAEAFWQGRMLAAGGEANARLVAMTDELAQAQFEEALHAGCKLARNGDAKGLEALFAEHPGLLRRHNHPVLHPDGMVVAAVEGIGGGATLPVLFRYGARADTINPKHGMPVLADAVMMQVQGSLAKVEALLKGGADPNGGPPPGTHLVYAIQAGSNLIVQHLLDAGADPNRPGNGHPPLAWAQIVNRPALVPRLLAAGASPEYAALVDPAFDPDTLAFCSAAPPASLRARHYQGGLRP